MVEIKDFTTTEISEVQRYVESQAPHSILTTTFILSENPIDKLKVFTTVYRILNSAKNYVKDDLKKKMNELLNEAEESYEKIYPLLLKYQSTIVEFGKNRLLKNLLNHLTNDKDHINKLIDAFLVFGEKIELMNIDKVTGLDLETDQGKDIMTDVNKSLGR